MADRDPLSLDFFNRHLPHTFHVVAPNGVVDLQLQQITPLPPPRRRGDSGTLEPIDAGTRAEPFSLLFIGPLEGFLPQRTYTVSVEGGEPFEIFIVPVARTADGFTYQAIFS